jgi:CheY-like chemotaxis protein
LAKILIADDDAKIRDILHTLLREHTLTVATTWPEVVEKIAAEPFDLVVTDVVMPGYKEMIKGGVRQPFEGRNLKVIFISAYNEASLTDLPSHMRFVKKPFSARLLKSMVDNALEGLAPSAPATS